MTPEVSIINFAKSDGLVPAIVQDVESAQVLMLAYMNTEAYTETLRTGLMTFFSRSRKELWQKGATSGNVLRFVSVELDCDQDTLLFRVKSEGPACHRGTASCFGDGAFRQAHFLCELEACIAQRRQVEAPDSYTRRLFEKGLPAIAQKVGEEATEVLIAALAQDKDAMVNETCDLLYHLLVLLNERGILLSEVVSVLERRHQERKNDG